MIEPNIRFKRDDGSKYPEWDSKTLKDVFKKIKKKNKDGSVSLVLTNSAEFGIIPQREFFDKDIANTEAGNTTEYLVVEPKSFVYNPRKSKFAPHGPFQQYKGDETGIVSPLYNCLTKISNDDDAYLNYYFKSSSWYRYVYENASQGARSDRESMTDDVFMGIPVYIPCIEEQKKIADLLNNMDSIISVSEAEVESLEKMKKVMMKKIFSQEVRFKKDDGSDYEEWESNTIDELCSFRRGSFPQPYGLDEWYDEKQGLPFIQVADVSDNGCLNPDTKRHISKAAEPASVFIPSGTVIVTIQGTIGKVAITSYDAYIDRTLLIINDISKCIEKDFFAVALRVLFNEEKKRADGGILKTITKETLKKFTVLYPYNIEEQRKIAEFFASMDEAISAAKEESEKYKELRKGLLQQMFI